MCGQKLFFHRTENKKIEKIWVDYRDQDKITIRGGSEGLQKNLGDCSQWQQETMWQASFRAPLAQSVKRWTFNPTVKGSSTLWGEKYTFFNKLEAAKHKNSETTNVTQKKSRRAAKV